MLNTPVERFTPHGAAPKEESRTAGALSVAAGMLFLAGALVLSGGLVLWWRSYLEARVAYVTLFSAGGLFLAGLLVRAVGDALRILSDIRDALKRR